MSRSVKKEILHWSYKSCLGRAQVALSSYQIKPEVNEIASAVNSTITPSNDQFSQQIVMQNLQQKSSSSRAMVSPQVNLGKKAIIHLSEIPEVKTFCGISSSIQRIPTPSASFHTITTMPIQHRRRCAMISLTPINMSHVRPNPGPERLWADV